MTMAENADLLSLGKHCFVTHCKQLDFLPFKCTFCEETFCLEHRTAESHQCPKSYVTDVHVPICPLCGKIVKKSKNEDVNAQVSYHIQSGCKELVVSQKAKKEKRCTFKGCKRHEILPFHCNQCQRQFCVRHRHAQDHMCHARAVYPVVTCA